MVLILFRHYDNHTYFFLLLLQNCICWHWFGTIIFAVMEEIVKSRYIGIFTITNKIIDISRLSQIISNSKELSAKLSISKIRGELSKIYRYKKKWLTAYPYSLHGGEAHIQKTWHNHITTLSEKNIPSQTWLWKIFWLILDTPGCCLPNKRGDGRSTRMEINLTKTATFVTADSIGACAVLCEFPQEKTGDL